MFVRPDDSVSDIACELPGFGCSLVVEAVEKLGELFQFEGVHVLHLVIGGTGLIGTALCDELSRRNLPSKGTTRFPSCVCPWLIGFDLREPDVAALPECSVLYLVAAIAGFGPCEDNPDAWRINVDANNELIDRYPDAFVVFISSDVVEKKGTAFYQETKREIERSVRAVRGARIRPARVVDIIKAGELAKVIVDVGLARKPGVTRWS